MRKVILIAVCVLVTGAFAQTTKAAPAAVTPVAAKQFVKKDSTMTSDTIKTVVCDTITVIKHKKTAVTTTETVDTLKKK